jgi:hypothetical protein
LGNTLSIDNGMECRIGFSFLEEVMKQISVSLRLLEEFELIIQTYKEGEARDYPAKYMHS